MTVAVQVRSVSKVYPAPRAGAQAVEALREISFDVQDVHGINDQPDIRSILAFGIG